MDALIIRKKNEKSLFVRYLLKRLEHNKNFLGIIVGQTGCLSGDTKLYNQTKTIEELYNSGQRFVNTISITKPKNRILHNGSYYPKKSKSEIIPSGQKEVYEIELENGEKVLATKEHKFFILRKGKRTEIELRYLKEGDKLICYPNGYIYNLYKKSREQTIKQRKKKFNHGKICSECKTLFFVNFGNGCEKLCLNCRETIWGKNKRIKGINKKQEKDWFEWEDNLIRNLYPDESKDKLLSLIPRSWNGICHRAHRLNIKRDGIEKAIRKYQFTSENNVMNNPSIREKARLSQKMRWQEGKAKLSGIALKSHNGLTKKENHPNWLGGISFEPYDKQWDKKYKEMIKQRDNYTCQICNEQKKTLPVHHIDYNKKNSIPSNCLTLCTQCHIKTNYNRKYWTWQLQIFMNLWNNYDNKIDWSKNVLLKN